MNMPKTFLFSFFFTFEVTNHTPVLYPCSPWYNYINARKPWR